MFCYGQRGRAARGSTYSEGLPGRTRHGTPAVSGPVRSSAILLAAPKPQQVVPQNADVVTTPGPSSSRSVQKTLVPGIAPPPVPEALTQPITLGQALQVAFQNSPAIRAALSQVEGSRGAAAEARARFNPTFTIQASATRPGAMQGNLLQSVPTSSTGASLSIVLPLDLAHGIKYASDMARSQFQIQYLSMVSVSEGLIVSVKSAYYGLLRACGQEAVAQSAVDSARVRLENIRARREEGAVAQFDLTSAEVELENLNQQLIAARNQVAIAQASLNEVLGVDVNYPTRVIAEEIAVTIDSVDIPQSMHEAYARRPELKAAQTAVTLYKTDVSLQRSALWPSLSLSGGPSYGSAGTTISDSDYSWQAVAAVSIPVWDGGVTRAKVRQAKADVQSAVASLDQTTIAVAKEVRAAALNLQEAALRTKTTAHAAALAEEALSLANVRYEAGIAVLVKVSNAQSQLTQAQDNYVNAQYDYAIALAQLQRATSSQPELDQLQLLADPVSAASHGNGVQP